MTNSERKETQPKQVIVVRKDLEMSPQKFSAQVSHAVLNSFLELGKRGEKSVLVDWSENKALEEWLDGGYKKVILKVKSEAALLKVYEDAKAKGLPSVLITDAGYTVFNGVPTHTCVGIAPMFPEDLKGVTDKLQLYT